MCGEREIRCQKEKYKKIVSEPVTKQNIRDYSGVHEVSDRGYLINIQVGSDGNVKAIGSEPANGGTGQLVHDGLKPTSEQTARFLDLLKTLMLRLSVELP